MSEKSICERLLLKPGREISFINAPDGFRDQMGELPPFAKISESKEHADVLLLFTRNLSEIAELFSRIVTDLKESTLFWVGISKKERKDRIKFGPRSLESLFEHFRLAGSFIDLVGRNLVRDEGETKMTTRSLTLSQGIFPSPIFLPDATFGVVRSVDAQDLEGVGIQAVVMNTFHLMLKPGSSTIQSLGGLHRMSGWNKSIVTDSGGFQAYSLIRQNPKFGTLHEKGSTSNRRVANVPIN
jgi:hypothetical protein